MSDLLKCGIDLDEVKRGAVEGVATVPAHVVLVLLVRGVLQRLEEVLEATGSAGILGWTGALATETKGELERMGRSELSLDGDGVLPAIAVVILLSELALPSQHLQDGDGLLIDFALGMLVETHPIARITDGKGVQVRIGPTHRGLQHVVQSRHSHARRHQDLSPDDGRDFIQFDE